MWFGIISLFPDMFHALQASITGRAIKDNLIQIKLYNPRQFTTDKYQSVDHSPYGGGPGMVMMAGPLQAAIHQAKTDATSKPTVIYLSPQGRSFHQGAARTLAEKKSLIFVAGRYEGIDERIIEKEIDEEWSIGDYILTGGELAAMVMIDTITRLLPGALGDAKSALEDSLTTGLLKYPQYTRPDNFMGATVPTVLLSGHHQKIATWRLAQSLGKTWLKRPDLLKKRGLTEEESLLLADFIEELLHKTR